MLEGNWLLIWKHICTALVPVPVLHPKTRIIVESKAADEEFDVEAELKEAMSRIKHPDRSTLVSSNQSNPSKIKCVIIYVSKSCISLFHQPEP